MTDDNGEFAATWVAEPRYEGSWDFYAVFEGDNQVGYARSETYSVTVTSSSSSGGSNSNQGGSSYSGSGTSNYYPSEIRLNKIPASVYANEVVTFTGKLTSNGQPLQNALIYIKEDDPAAPDETLANGRTDSNGEFSIQWRVGAGLVETDFDIYAIFEGTDSFEKARSYNQIMSVLKYGSSISLDPLPPNAKAGDVLTFSGTLQLGQGSTQGAIVYIKDEDPLNPDDLLATAYVNANGEFSANWFVVNVDEDTVADVYAVFEGNDILYRVTTCDLGPTGIFGAGCPNTIKLRIIESSIIPPPTPTPTPTPPGDDKLNGGEYMNLYYSLSFNRNPTIAIVPQPDSYDQVKKYIIPVQEGVIMWQSDLENKYGGSWDINFEIIEQGSLFFDKEPDIIMNIVSYDNEMGCGHVNGWAKVTGIKPINTLVCATSFGASRSTSDVAVTAAHEFIHAVGLGHTFNKKGDLMCSAEIINGVWQDTCPSSFTRSKSPSDLNLAAVAKLYRTDGFKDPNNRISWGTKFIAAESLDGGFSGKDSQKNQPTPAPTPKPTPQSPKYSPSPATKTKTTEKSGFIKTEPTFDYKTNTFKVQSDVNSKIKSMKSGVYRAQEALYSTHFNDAKAKNEVDKAWTSLWWAKKYLGDSEWLQKQSEKLIKKSNFKDAYNNYKSSLNNADKINKYLLEITAHIKKAKSLEK